MTLDRRSDNLDPPTLNRLQDEVYRHSALHIQAESEMRPLQSRENRQLQETLVLQQGGSQPPPDLYFREAGRIRGVLAHITNLSTSDQQNRAQLFLANFLIRDFLSDLGTGNNRQNNISDFLGCVNGTITRPGQQVQQQDERFRIYRNAAGDLCIQQGSGWASRRLQFDAISQSDLTALRSLRIAAETFREHLSGLTQNMTGAQARPILLRAAAQWRSENSFRDTHADLLINADRRNFVLHFINETLHQSGFHLEFLRSPARLALHSYNITNGTRGAEITPPVPIPPPR